MPRTVVEAEYKEMKQSREELLRKRLFRMRMIAVFFALSSIALAGGWVFTWMQVNKLFFSQMPPLPELPHPQTSEVSPLQVHYQLDLPGKGEIFPALQGVDESAQWPFAVLTISNSSEHPVVQTVSAEVLGWSVKAQMTFVLAPRETRKVMLKPALKSRAYALNEMAEAILQVRASGPQTTDSFSQNKRIYLHSASDLYWGNQFANAQFIARWVTPHDPAVLKLVSSARRFAPRMRLPGYNDNRTKKELDASVRAQANAVFRALQRTGLSYVTSIFTFGNFRNVAQRVRFPRETLEIHSANCIDVSVAFASAIENLGMNPVIVIVPGHAFTGVRLGPNSTDVLYLDLTVLPKGSFAAAEARAKQWLKKTPPEKVITVNIAAARALGIYPLPTGDTWVSNDGQVRMSE
jgi:hypothetical protein